MDPDRRPSVVVAARTVAQLLSASGLVPVDARVLLGFTLGRDRAWLAAHGDAGVAPDAQRRFGDLARRRRAGEPVAYLIGRREFYGLELEVNRDVLIPRPETETLVDAALDMLSPVISSLLHTGARARILDLGTGSGAIALAIAKHRPATDVLASDVSPGALALAQRNADRLGIGNVRFLASDWFARIPPQAFDLIVANPPYVADNDPHLSEGDVRHEPPLALRGGSAGLAAIEAIIAAAPPYLEAAGWLMFEHGYDQADAVRERLRAAAWTDHRSVRDLAGIVRVTAARRPT